MFRRFWINALSIRVNIEVLIVLIFLEHFIDRTFEQGVVVLHAEKFLEIYNIHQWLPKFVAQCESLMYCNFRDIQSQIPVPLHWMYLDLRDTQLPNISSRLRSRSPTSSRLSPRLTLRPGIEYHFLITISSLGRRPALRCHLSNAPFRSSSQIPNFDLMR